MAYNPELFKSMAAVSQANYGASGAVNTLMKMNQQRVDQGATLYDRAVKRGDPIGMKQAREMMAEADAKYNKEMVASLGGVENYTKLKVLGDLLTAWQEGGAVPQISVSGSQGGGSMDAILAQLMKQMAGIEDKAAK